MTAPATAGDLRFRVRFERRKKVEDQYGAKEGAWESGCERWADIRPMRGSEPVLAQRLTGTQPVLIIVRNDSDTRCITSGWRAIRLKSGKPVEYFAVKIAQDMERENDFLTILAETGTADSA